ncbi:unnamed protein product [Durusdinium trenchii]|uniref:Uncharacterized protein n=1 Tax=Durusdinium trenchii TaxID=1381693 RepID=A0ABP0R6E6_9DINO
MAALCLLALFVGAAATSANDDCPESSFDVRMLQLETSVSGTNTHLKKGQARNLTNCGHLIQETCDPDANAFCSNNCKVHTHGQDCYRPVPDVMAEHPGEDGYCYFNQTGFWVSPLPVPPNFETSSIQGILGLRGADYHGKDQGPLITFHFEGQVLTTYMDLPHYSYDDLYGYSLGYLQNQGLDAVMMKNSSFWIERSKQKCLEIQETYHFQNESGPKHVNQATRNSKIARLGLGFIFINHLGREIFRRHAAMPLDFRTRSTSLLSPPALRKSWSWPIGWMTTSCLPQRCCAAPISRQNFRRRRSGRRPTGRACRIVNPSPQKTLQNIITSSAFWDTPTLLRMVHI